MDFVRHRKKEMKGSDASETSPRNLALLQIPESTESDSKIGMGKRKCSPKEIDYRMSFDTGDTHVSIPQVVSAKPRERTVEEYMCKRNMRVIILSGSAPFHVQFANKEWSRACGWSAEEVLGLDCKFLQGEATSMRAIRKFLTNLNKETDSRELAVLNYKKDDTLLANRLVCFPIKNALFQSKKPGQRFPFDQIAHFVCILEDSNPVDFTNEQMISRLGHQLEEVGLPIDRREQAMMYPYFQKYPAPKLHEWAMISKKLTLTMALQYMLETQAPAILVDSQYQVVHMNPVWASFLACTHVDSEGRQFDEFVHESTEDGQMDILFHLISNGNSRDRSEYANVVLQPRRTTISGWRTQQIGQLWKCAVTATKVSTDYRMVIVLWGLPVEPEMKTTNFSPPSTASEASAKSTTETLNSSSKSFMSQSTESPNAPLGRLDGSECEMATG